MAVTPRPVVWVLAALLVAPLAHGQQDQSNWEFLEEKAGVRVERSPAKAGQVAYRATARIEQPADAVREVLKDLERFPEWADRLHTWEVLAREGDATLVYGRHDVPWPIADRDYVVRYRCGGGDDAFFLEARSVESSERPVPEGVVRIADLHTLWEVTPAPEPSASVVRYTYRGGLGGRVPEWVQELVRGGSMRSSFERLEARVAAVRQPEAGPSRPSR